MQFLPMGKCHGTNDIIRIPIDGFNAVQRIQTGRIYSAYFQAQIPVYPKQLQVHVNNSTFVYMVTYIITTLYTGYIDNGLIQFKGLGPKLRT